MVRKYDFDNNKLVYFKPVDKEHEDREYEIETDSGFIKTKLDIRPYYIGNVSEFFDVTLKFKYPDSARGTGISGIVYVSFLIDTNGIAKDYKIEEGIGGGCDEEALRIAKQLPNNWLPGYLNGKPVVIKYTYPFKFKP